MIHKCTYLENWNTSKTNFSSLIPLGDVGFTDCPFASIYGIFFLATWWGRSLRWFLNTLKWRNSFLLFGYLPKYLLIHFLRSNLPEMLLGNGVLKICSKLIGEHPCRSVISIKLQSSLFEITLRHGCSPVNLQQFSEHLFLRTSLDGCFCFFQLSTPTSIMQQVTGYTE